jgi:hypothetical protein
MFSILTVILAISTASVQGWAGQQCMNVLKTPEIFRLAKDSHSKHPEEFQRYIEVFVESGFFLGPKMLEVFEKQLINDGLITYDVNRKSFVATKEQAKRNHEVLTQMTAAPREQLIILSGKILEELKINLALDLPPGSEKLCAELMEQHAFKERPWDHRSYTLEQLKENHKVLSEMLRSSEGQALVADMILEAIPLWAHMLSKLLIYNNKEVDLASAVAGKIGWSLVLSTAVGYVDPVMVTQIAAAAAGALIDMPGMNKTISYFRNREIAKLQQEVSWSLASKLRCESHQCEEVDAQKTAP